MKNPSSNRGAASALAIVGIVIVGWTIGMLLQGVEVRRKQPTRPEKTAVSKIHVHLRPSGVNQNPR